MRQNLRGVLADFKWINLFCKNRAPIVIRMVHMSITWTILTNLSDTLAVVNPMIGAVLFRKYGITYKDLKKIFKSMEFERN